MNPNSIHNNVNALQRLTQTLWLRIVHLDHLDLLGRLGRGSSEDVVRLGGEEAEGGKVALFDLGREDGDKGSTEPAVGS